jgi:hypothetical protein
MDAIAHAGIVAGGSSRPYRDPDIILVTEDAEDDEEGSSAPSDVRHACGPIEEATKYSQAATRFT